MVRDGEVVGEGWHAELGDLHAERAALADCGERGNDPARATMYVTLEPCAHQGRQPPCVEAILEAGIARVVIASDDPSEKAAGRGPGILRDGGVEVEFAAGEEASAARLLNQPFRKHARTGLPLVTLKLAMSLDGQTTTQPGDSPWISSEQSRNLVHQWRTESDSIAAGINTVLTDNPLLTARPQASGAPYPRYEGKKRTGTDPRQPLRVVFDRRARLPLDSQLLQTLDQSPVLVVVAPQADASALRNAGAEVLVADGIEAALADLGRRGITSLFLEGGRTLAAAFQAADQLDEARTFIAPTLLGTGPSAARAGCAVGGPAPEDALATGRGGGPLRRQARAPRRPVPRSRTDRRRCPDHGQIQGVVMFTGLIEDIGKIESLESGEDGARVRIATRLAAEIATGDSVAVNGVCLTATAVDADSFETEAMNQTLTVTALGGLADGDRVNLELAMKASDRLGGHIVQGHADGVATVASIEDDGFARRLRVGLAPELIRYVVEKGSITLNGVSLTVADLGDSWAVVSLIPETLERTTLGEARSGTQAERRVRRGGEVC